MIFYEKIGIYVVFKSVYVLISLMRKVMDKVCKENVKDFFLEVFEDY